MTIPMDLGSLLGTVVLALLVLAVALLMPYAIGRNLVRGHTYREQLDEALSNLRISNMLGYLGIDKAEYLHKQQSVEIQQHMAKCDACDEKALCDETLSKPGGPQAELGFCANIDDLVNVRQEQQNSKEASA